MNAKTDEIQNNKPLNPIQSQARSLICQSRQRKQNRQRSMLKRASELLEN